MERELVLLPPAGNGGHVCVRGGEEEEGSSVGPAATSHETGVARTYNPIPQKWRVHQRCLMGYDSNFEMCSPLTDAVNTHSNTYRVYEKR